MFDTAAPMNEVFTPDIGRPFVIVRPVKYEGKERTVVVLGAPRGGTSMVAGTLRLLGLFMGQKLGHQHEDPAFRRDTSLETKLSTIHAYNAQHASWGWKLPNTIYYYGQLHSSLRNPVFIVIYRNPLSVAKSSARRDGRVFTKHLLDVPINHYKRMHRVIDEHPDVPLAVCSFDDISAGKKKRDFIEQMAEFVGIDPSAEQIEHAIAFIDPAKGYKKF